MVVQDKKTGGNHICVKLHNLNYAYIHDPFPTLFIEKIMENVGGKEVYSFIDGFSGYHKVKIIEEDIHKMTFAIWEGMSWVRCF